MNAPSPCEDLDRTVGNHPFRRSDALAAQIAKSTSRSASLGTP